MHCDLLKSLNTSEKIVLFETLKVKTNFSIEKKLELVGQSKSTYYDNKVKKISINKFNRKKIQDDIIEIFENSGSTYGAPKILASLLITKNSNIRIPVQSTISRYMKEIGLNPVIKTRYRSKNKQIKINKFIHNNYLKYDRPKSPGTHFVTDMTYIYTKNDGWVYLLTYMDLYTRQIVAFDVSISMEVNWVVTILKRVIRQFPNIFIIHSDRGSQYTSENYRDILSQNDIIQSYSKKGYPYDNAWIESFHKSLKQEKLKHQLIMNITEAYQLCCEYILTYYNSVRIHSSLNYKTPNEFARLSIKTG